MAYSFIREYRKQGLPGQCSSNQILTRDSLGIALFGVRVRFGGCVIRERYEKVPAMTRFCELKSHSRACAWTTDTFWTSETLVSLVNPCVTPLLLHYICQQCVHRADNHPHKIHIVIVFTLKYNLNIIKSYRSCRI